MDSFPDIFIQKNKHDHGSKSFGSGRTDMGIFLSHRNVTRLSYEDLGTLENLRGSCDAKRMGAMFGEIDLEQLLMKSWLTLGLQNANNEVIAVMCLNNYPNVPAVPPWDWDNWIRKVYGFVTLNCLTTVWIHLLMWHPSYFYFFMKPMVHYLFNLRNTVEDICMIIPPNTVLYTDFLGTLGVKVKPLDEVSKNSLKTQAMYLISKKAFTLNFKIRKCVEEDNDDLIPIIEKQCPELSEIYGKYFIAELIQHGQNREIIVAELHNEIVGVLCLNQIINYEVLNREFDLVPFNGFRKPHKGDSVPLQDTEIYEHLDDPEMEQGDLAYTKTDSEENLIDVTRSEFSDYSLVFTTSDIFYFQGELAEDYDDYPVDVDLQASDDDELDYETFRVIDGTNRHDRMVPNAEAVNLLTPKIILPTYLGEPNAFSLEILAVTHDACLPLLFKAAFKAFPDRDYCVMSISTTSHMNYFTTYFSRISPRVDGTFPHELYFMQKKTLLGSLDVQLATEDHAKRVKAMLSTIPSSNTVWQQFDNYITNDHSLYTAMVILYGHEVVGVSTVSEEMNVQSLHTRYDTFPVKPLLQALRSHGVFESLVISPIFEVHSQCILREIHRLSQFDVLYYKVRPYSWTLERDRPLNNLLPHFIQLLPLMLPDNNVKLIKTEKGPDLINVHTKEEDKDVFALYLSTPATCFRKKINIANRIVIDGCNHTTIGFLMELLRSKNLLNSIHFTNVTLICNEWLMHSKVSHLIHDAFLVKKSFIDAKYLDMINLKAKVNIAKGNITALDRKEKFVTLDDSGVLPYDLLILAQEERFSVPDKMTVHSAERPHNVFLINSAYDANSSIRELKKIINRHGYTDESKIVVYGHYIEAYCTIHGLLAYGVPGEHLVFVEPFPPSKQSKISAQNVSFFNDPTIDEAVLDYIQLEGIQYYSAHELYDWTFDEENQEIINVRFESQYRLLKIDCLALFLFAEKEIPNRMVRVLRNVGLVYDGRLVIDAAFRTNDPNIYAAGSLTKYSRKYCSLFSSHKYYNKEEIGRSLGYQIRSQLLPSFIKEKKSTDGWNFHIERGENLLPHFENPIMKYCLLPGGLYYYTVMQPGITIPLEVAMSMETYGNLLITGSTKCLDALGYFQLHVSTYGRVQSITCIAKTPINIHNLYCIWGKHERMLNSLLIRFEAGQISDLFSFFDEHWMHMICHDNFNKLCAELNDLISSMDGLSGKCIVSDVIVTTRPILAYGKNLLEIDLDNSGERRFVYIIELYKQNKWHALSPEEDDELEKRFLNSEYNQVIQNKVMDFLGVNLTKLQAYAHPKIIKYLLMYYEDSPMFKKEI